MDRPLLDTAQALNQGCYCRTLNPDRLRQHLESDPCLVGLTQHIAQTRPHLYSATVVFLSQAVHEQITQAIAALERVISLPAYQAHTLPNAPAIAQHDFGPVGLFMGYDFHIGRQGPRLIEINTNAGGALLNAPLARAQQSCCQAMDWAFVPNDTLNRLDDTFFDMFQREWQHQRGGVPMGTVAIVDDTPQTQYLAPEFTLCQQLLQQRGIQARIVDPADFTWQDGRLMHAGQTIDMVYNRLTDFYLAESNHQALRQAYEAGAVVLTPHPRAHALHADKRNLVTLSDTEQLARWGVPEVDRQRLQAVMPHTVRVTPDQADALWAQRRQWFFKPEAGYGAKGAYRGDKLTRKVWGEILAGGYVAQALVPPSERMILVDDAVADLKFDIRAYTYDGEVLLFAARMYAGQTTNFRTPGGGFAPVVMVPSDTAF